MKTYDLVFQRTSTQRGTMQIEASDLEEAQQMADEIDGLDERIEWNAVDGSVDGRTWLLDVVEEGAQL
jgi:hypothetical protein